MFHSHLFQMFYWIAGKSDSQLTSHLSRAMSVSTYTHTQTQYTQPVKKPFVKNKLNTIAVNVSFHTHILIKKKMKKRTEWTVKCIIIQRFSTFYVFSSVLYAIIRQSQTVSSSGETCATTLTDTTSKKTAKDTNSREKKYTTKIPNKKNSNWSKFLI